MRHIPRWTTPRGADEVADLCGRYVSEVAFVRDYLELVFEGGKRLAILFWPIIVVDGEAREVDWSGYEKALRSLIDTPLLSVETATRGSGLSLEFGGGGLELAPADEELSGPEIMQLFDPKTERSTVWRHGDPPFAPS